MSLDDQHREMLIFTKKLGEWNKRVGAALDAFRWSHDNLDALWQGFDRDDYSSRWRAFEDQMSTCVNRDGPGFEEFLRHRAEALRRYLHG